MNNQTFKDIRHYLKMSQIEFSEFTGISRVTIAHIETDRLRVSEHVQVKLAHVFDITDDDFLQYQQRKRSIEKYISER